MKSARFLFCLLIALAVVSTAVAQEGYPLSGTWSGDWGTSAKEEERTDTTLVLSWDGKSVQGIVDPGPDSAKIKVATLDSTKWTVHMEYDLKDKSGKVMPFIVDGKLQNPASRKNRTVEGSYTHGTAKGTFKITMD
jgi:hypothetical protein